MYQIVSLIHWVCLCLRSVTVLWQLISIPYNTIHATRKHPYLRFTDFRSRHLWRVNLNLWIFYLGIPIRTIQNFVYTNSNCVSSFRREQRKIDGIERLCAEICDKSVHYVLFHERWTLSKFANVAVASLLFEIYRQVAIICYILILDNSEYK